MVKKGADVLQTSDFFLKKTSERYFRSVKVPEDVKLVKGEKDVKSDVSPGCKHL